MATINLPAVDSDVSIFINAVNLFGPGPGSSLARDKISKLHVLHVYIRM